MSHGASKVLAILLIGATVGGWFYLSVGEAEDNAFSNVAETPPTDGRGPLKLTTSAECESCHPTIYSEWKESHHALSWVNPEPRRKELSDNFKNTDCIPCHAPRPMLEVGYGLRALERRRDREDGINCLTCHQFRNVIATPNPMQGPAAALAPCNPVTWKPMGEIRFCTPCHDQHKVHRDWSQTRFAVEGPSKKDCNDCHMAVVDGPATVGTNGKTHSDHRFLGAHSEVMLRGAATLEATLFAEGGDRFVGLSVLNSNTGHNLPADERHRAVDLTVRWLPDDGEAGSWTRLARFRNPYRHEFDIINPFKVPGVPVRVSVAMDGKELVVGQVRVAASHNPKRHEYYPESTQILAGEARALWFAVPWDRPGRLQVHLYYKLNPYMTDENAVLMRESILSVSPASIVGRIPDAIAKARGTPMAASDETSTRLIPRGWTDDVTARLLADEEADLTERLDAMDSLDPSSVSGDSIEALLLVMKDRSQQAFLSIPDESSLGYHVVENPLGGPDDRYELRWRAIITLERLKAASALPDFLSALHDRHPVVRNHAARALWMLGNREGLAVLLKALSGRAFENETANRILREITDLDAGYDTDSGWANKVPAIERWAKIIEALPTHEPPVFAESEQVRLDRRIHFLIAVLGQHQFLFMEQARRTLSGMGSLAVRHLSSTLGEGAPKTNQQLRAYAIQAVGVIAQRGNDGALKLLIDRLSRDASPVVRSRAATALSGLSAAGALSSALDDSDMGVRVSAILALGGTPSAKSDGLIARFRSWAASKDDPELVRRTAAFSLLRWSASDEVSRRTVLGCLQSPSISLRAEVAVFLKNWLGDLHGYDPDVLPSEQAKVIDSWALKLNDF